MTEAPRPLPYPWSEVKAALQRDMRGLLDRLGFAKWPIEALDGHGRGIVPLNPRRQDRRPGSFVIWTDGAGAGAWKDYAIGREGDLFQLVEYVLGLARPVDAYWWAVDHLGWDRRGHGDAIRAADDRKLAAERAEAERAAEAKRLKADDDAKAAKAKAWWLSAQAEIRGTPVWTYLTGKRGLPLERLGSLPGAIRYLPRCEHTDRETGEVTEWPCMLTAMSAVDGGQVRAVHRTWLAPDGSDKAPVAKPKKMWGAVRGSTIRVWKGAGGLTPEQAAARGAAGPLIVTEGIEDALTAAIAQPASRVWAAGSVDTMRGFAWPACASAVVLVADNDWHEPQAIEAFAKVEAHWKAVAAGRPVKAVRAAVGKDLNDWARARPMEGGTTDG